MTISIIPFLSLAVATSQGLADPIDYRQCQNTSDYGWPRFENSSALEASPWAEYLKQMYGKLPLEYPFCTFDLWFINSFAQGYKDLSLVPDPSKASIGNHIGHIFHEGDYNDGDFYQTDFGLWNYHSGLVTVESNYWIEVQHLLFPTETDAMWFTRARGSGIWYNVGKTISFPSDAGHFHAYRYFAKLGCEYPTPSPPPVWPLNCSDPVDVEYCLELAAGRENALAKCAAALGYESIQFGSGPGPIIQTFGHVGWLELLSTSLRGNYSCGTPEGGTSAGFRSGWNASSPCDCIEGGYPYAPTNCDGNQ